MKTYRRLLMIAFGLASLLGFSCSQLIADDESVSANRIHAFDGLWMTTYGKLRIRKNGNAVVGIYRSGDVIGTLQGSIIKSSFQFRYSEPSGDGRGSFELSGDGQKLNGSWTADGDSTHQWTGKRIKESNDTKWLLVFETVWERDLNTPSQSFGRTLREYFTSPASPNVIVRHRTFADASQLRMLLAEAQLLSGRAVIVVAAHGNQHGVETGLVTVGPEIVQDMVAAANVDLVHFSSCCTLAGDFGKLAHKVLRPHATFPISGYSSLVEWHAGTLSDLTYLTFILARGQSPAKAAASARASSSYIGDGQQTEDGFECLGLVFLPAPDGHSTSSNATTTK